MDDALYLKKGVPEPVPPNPVCPLLVTRETEDGKTLLAENDLGHWSSHDS